MRILMFYHSVLSDWNHGNAHFLRGVATELISRGHDVWIFEPENSWSLGNLLQEHGEKPLRKFRGTYPKLNAVRYRLDTFALEQELEQADLVIVHEWNDHSLVPGPGAVCVAAFDVELLENFSECQDTVVMGQIVSRHAFRLGDHPVMGVVEE